MHLRLRMAISYDYRRLVGDQTFCESRALKNLGLFLGVVDNESWRSSSRVVHEAELYTAHDVDMM